MNSSKLQLTELLFEDTHNQKAEIIWILLCLFPDSKIAQSIELGPRKLKYIVPFGVALHFKEILYEQIKKVVM